MACLFFYISTCVDARLERADPEEVKEAMTEGVKFRYLSALNPVFIYKALT